MAAVGTGVLGALSSLPGAYAAGDETIKVGLIGCGGRGTGAAQQALSTQGNVKLVAMADAFPWQLDDSFNKLSKWAAAERPDRMAVDDDHKFVGLDAYRQWDRWARQRLKWDDTLKARHLSNVLAHGVVPGGTMPILIL